LFIIGGLAVLYVAFTLLHARFYQDFSNNTLDQQIHAQEKNEVSSQPATAREGDVLGRIEIPRLAVRVAILEGTTPQTLRLGVGHIRGTARPGASGNIGIAGHRDTYFRELKDIRTDDEIQVLSANGLSHYRVDWVRIVTLDDIAILAPSAHSAVTLVTCYPFHYIGAAPKRYVVHAKME
jgi:sortase A